MVQDEQGLLERVRNEDGAALQEFVERFKKHVFFLALDLTGNHHDAEDLSQDVFLKAFTSVKGFRGDSRISSWLHRITVNTYIDERRKSSFKLMKLQQYFSGGPSKEENEKEQEFPSPGPDPQATFEQKRIQTDIQKALKTLSPQQKAVFVLRHYQELSLKEISEALAISEGTVKSLLFRAVRKLQRSLSAYRIRPQWEDLQ
jgi:RNA polymerase sigma-70 factor (ECF subfamily)